ncbi:MAG: hypothetical protein ACR2N4_01435 [Jatrophihabitans sp.]
MLIAPAQRSVAALALAAVVLAAVVLGTGCSASPPSHAGGQRNPVLAALIASSHSSRWAASTDQPVAYRLLQLHLIVYVSVPARTFALRRLSSSEVQIDSASAGSYRTAESQPATAVNAVSQRHWIDGSQAATGRAPVSQVVRYRPGEYSFLDQGSSLTYQGAHGLGTDPVKIRSVIGGHLAALGPPSSASVLRETGVLLAAAPLSPDSRAALWQAAFEVPGVHDCGQRTDLAARHGTAYCATGGSLTTGIVLDPGTGAVLSVQQWLAKPDPTNYPTMLTGDLIQDDTYLPIDSQEPCDSRC